MTPETQPDTTTTTTTNNNNDTGNNNVRGSAWKWTDVPVKVSRILSGSLTLSAQRDPLEEQRAIEEITQSMTLFQYAPPSVLSLAQQPPLSLPDPPKLLPSFDLDCIVIFTLLKLLQSRIGSHERLAQFSVENCNEPSMSPNERLPFIMLQGGRTFAMDEIVELLERRMGIAIQETNDLNNCENAPESNCTHHHHHKDDSGEEALLCHFAALSLVKFRIRPAIEMALWSDPDIFATFTKPNYAQNVPWPVSELVMWRMRRQKNAKSHRSAAAIIQHEAIQAINDLSRLLGDNVSFCKNGMPGLTDAIVFAHLSMIRHAIPPKHDLSIALHAAQNLVTFLDDIGHLCDIS